MKKHTELPPAHRAELRHERVMKAWNDANPIVIPMSLDPENKQLYLFLIGLVQSVDTPVWFEQMRRRVLEILADHPLDAIAATYLENAVEQLRLEIQMLEALLPHLPPESSQFIYANTPAFDELMDNFSISIASIENKKAVDLFLDEFVHAYEDLTGRTVHTLGFDLWHILGLQTGCGDPPRIILFDRFMRAIPPGNNHEKIKEALHAHREQMDFIEHALLPSFVRDPGPSMGMK